MNYRALFFLEEADHMEQDVDKKKITKPEEVVSRFCGYCGVRYAMVEHYFLRHVNQCEYILVMKSARPFGDKK